MQVIRDALTLNSNSVSETSELLFDKTGPNQITIQAVSPNAKAEEAFGGEGFHERWRLPQNWDEIPRKSLSESTYGLNVKISPNVGGSLAGDRSGVPTFFDEDMELPEPYRLFADLAAYVPLDVLFGMQQLASLDYVKQSDGSCTLLWSEYGAEDYNLPPDLWRRLVDHVVDGHRRLDVPNQGVVMDDRGLPMTRHRWIEAISARLSARDLDPGPEVSGYGRIRRLSACLARDRPR